jgi:redox-sensitive bicupin YhaK (pirin superfamily)
MLTLRPAQQRGHANHGWLDSWHTFSFANYYDDAHMGFRSLRVINDDIVAAQRGFGAHPHQDMEILTYVLAGELTHQDSTGAKGVLRPGIIQRMSAGTGVVHSEMNRGQQPVHLLQIWIEPAVRGVRPRYDDKDFPLAERRDRLRLLASGDGRDGSLAIHQDADLLAGVLADGVEVRHALKPGRAAWVQVARGALDLNGQAMSAGDGAAIEDEAQLTIRARGGEAEVLLFDLA